MEARDVVKDVGRAVLGLPKEPQPQKKFNERGCCFFILAGCCVPFSGPIFGTLVFTVLGPVLGVIFMTFLSFFSLLGVTWSKQRF